MTRRRRRNESLRGGSNDAVPTLPEGAGEPAAGPVLVVLLLAGRAGAVPVNEQVRPPRRGRLQRPNGPGGHAHRGAAGDAGEGRDPGGAGPTAARLVAPP